MGEDLELLRSQLEELRSQLEQREAEVTAREEVRGAPPTEPTDDAETPASKASFSPGPGPNRFGACASPPHLLGGAVRPGPAHRRGLCAEGCTGAESIPACCAAAPAAPQARPFSQKRQEASASRTPSAAHPSAATDCAPLPPGP